ncbi:nitroreductase family protein [Lutimonas saemankumensis]|uniref:nitroreductase family protein n=1 Tax=Lutimonas saemankumensis TaxID=483016 RepID=UPI001CD7F442|nr:nitroreductase family protein [Lutimonas saemankumensis]MCA0933581.1 nitroreductase family protein [Lutimonas saemankumensis]
MEFKEAVNRRRSVRKYDPDKTLDPQKVKECLELAVLAPNSSNMQLWEFYHITSKEILTKMSPFCFDQNAAKTAQQMVVIVVRKDLWKKRVKAHVAYLKNVFGDIPKEQQSKRAKFAFTYYTKIIPLAYADFLGLLGYIKYSFYWMIGLFRPIYRQARKSDMRIVAHKSAGLAAQTFMLAMADINYDTCPMEGIDSLRIKKLLKIPSSAEINMVISCGIRLPEGVYGERFRIPFEQVYKEV